MVAEVAGSVPWTPLSDPIEEFPMCRPVPCTVCGKITWEGCGEHVDQVKAQVPADQWCPGHGEAQQQR